MGFPLTPPNPHEEPKPTEAELVAEWRLEQCRRIVGYDHAAEFAGANVDLHRLAQMVAAGCSLLLLREILL